MPASLQTYFMYGDSRVMQALTRKRFDDTAELQRFGKKHLAKLSNVQKYGKIVKLM